MEIINHIVNTVRSYGSFCVLANRKWCEKGHRIIILLNIVC